MSYHQLIYSSLPVVDVTESLLLEILDSAQPKNSDVGITGLLAFHNGRFIQLLEGSEEAVNRLYQVIRSDPRHTDLKLELNIKTAQRSVPSWNMGFTSSRNFDVTITGRNYYFPWSFVKGMCEMMRGEVDKKFLQLLNA
ncbi:blue light- and temperature-regulated antirepressor YcgF [mine drainage metagenome]|uniref:Blue light-and temperature-regulated antirepressor YcgF n=1 Tax=mine drainage metagenome TaxID=410659 RepID=A0A1J5R7G0_9ZZZZ